VHANETLLTRFYEALSGSDEAGVAACFAADYRYHDPVFQQLEGARAVAMWRMFCERGDELTVRYSDVVADDVAGSARWEATYAFSKTGRPVHNRISSVFRFRDGLIVDQRDSFSAYRWASMALGVPGRVAGWAPPFRAAVTKQAVGTVDAFMRKRGIDAS
jgi:ketosteroid isomerase-like protein